MPRPSKKVAAEAPKPPVAAVPVAPAQPVAPVQIPHRHIDVEGFIRVRDSPCPRTDTNTGRERPGVESAPASPCRAYALRFSASKHYTHDQGARPVFFAQFLSSLRPIFAQFSCECQVSATEQALTAPRKAAFLRETRRTTAGVYMFPCRTRVLLCTCDPHKLSSSATASLLTFIHTETCFTQDADHTVKVHQRLITILELIKNFSEDYYRQTSLLLGEPANEGIPGIDLPLLNLEHAVAQNMGLPTLALQPGAPYQPAPVEEKKERKKRTHDPNAPKRPLTPYFLYMQTARPIIASDLGEQAPKGAVQEEGQRRWKAMNPVEKAGWNNAYQYNLRLYQARVHAYKQGGNQDARLMDDEAALKYAEEHSIQIAPSEAVADENDAIADQLTQGASVDAVGEDDDEEEAPAPVKTPKKPASTRKRKTATPAAEADAKNTTTPASPDKKRRRTSTKAADAVEEPATAKKSRSKKKN